MEVSDSIVDHLRQVASLPDLSGTRYELEAEIVKLRQIIEENAIRNSRVKELEQKNTELEARLAILELGSLQWIDR